MTADESRTRALEIAISVPTRMPSASTANGLLVAGAETDCDGYCMEE